MFIKNRIINDSYWTYPYLVYASEPSYVYARKCVLFIIQWRPDMDRLTKRTIPEYRPPFFNPNFFPIHIMYYQIQKVDRPAIRDMDHPFSVPNHKRTRKTDQPQKQKKFTFTVIQWRPGMDRLTKRTIPEYRPPFFNPKFFPIHIMYYQIQKVDRPVIRDMDHPFSVPNHKRTRKTDQPQKEKKITFTVIPAAAGFTNGTSCIWIH